jgi:type I restriction enzyme S subunit
MSLGNKGPWIRELPEKWRLTAIKRLVSTKITDGPHETPELADDGVQFISAEAIKNDQIDFTLRRGFISRELHDQYCRKCKPQREDIFVIKSGATTGNVAYVDVDFEFSIWSPLALIRCDKRIAFYKFVYYVFLSDIFRKQVELAWSFGTQQNIGMGVIERLKVPLPPIEEQQRIVAYLDSSCAAINAAMIAKRRQIETLDSLRKAIISRAVTHGLAPQPKLRQVDHDWLKDVPAHWDVCRVKRVSECMDYGISVSTVEEGRYPVLKMGHLQDGEISFSNLDFIDELDENLLLETGDLLYNRTNSPDQVGKAAIFRKSRADAITFASYLVRLRVNHRANPFFLNYVFNSDGFLGFARRLAIQSVQQSNLNSTRYSQLFIPLPPVTEQDTIFAYLDEKVAELKRIIEGIESQIATLTAYRKSLIHECVTGQRRITDADLNRVKAHG